MNKNIQLDLSAFINALKSLNDALEAHNEQHDNLFIRDALIHRFKYSYELAHKMPKRFLEMTEPSAEEIDQMSFSNLICTGAERGLLKNSWDKWAIYRTARNATSHTYNETKAMEVCRVIPEFYQDAQYLLHELQERARKQ